MSITENINDETSLDVCKGPNMLGEGKNTADESSTKSDNTGSVANNYRATEIDYPEDESRNISSPLDIKCFI